MKKSVLRGARNRLAAVPTFRLSSGDARGASRAPYADYFLCILLPLHTTPIRHLRADVSRRVQWGKAWEAVQRCDVDAQRRALLPPNDAVQIAYRYEARGPSSARAARPGAELNARHSRGEMGV